MHASCSQLLDLRPLHLTPPSHASSTIPLYPVASLSAFLLLIPFVVIPFAGVFVGPALFVAFVAPWCSHCNLLKAPWQEVAEAFTGESHQQVDQQVRIGQVDCVKEKELCKVSSSFSNLSLARVLSLSFTLSLSLFLSLSLKLSLSLSLARALSLARSLSRSLSLKCYCGSTALMTALITALPDY